MAGIAQRLLSSNNPTRHASAASARPKRPGSETGISLEIL